MPSNKQRKEANRLEYWLRWGPLPGNRDPRWIYREQLTYVRRCTCGLTYAKYNYIPKQRVIGGWIFGAIILGTFVHFGYWWLGLYLFVAAYVFTALFLQIMGHSLRCAERRALYAIGGAL